jgi:ATP-dependent protease ClpP protease subunit
MREDIFPAELLIAPPVVVPARTLRYIGSVIRATNERVLAKMEKLVAREPEEDIFLFVTSTGGPTGTAMSFYDTVEHVLKPRLTTIGSGDVDSAGIVIYLAGDRRYVTLHTTLLLHPAGRHFGTERYTTREMEAMLAEDRLKDAQYASLIATRSHGRLRESDVLQMMERHTVLAPLELVRLGLADAVLA